MSSELSRLRVKSGGVIRGPISEVDVANLLAEGRIDESDLISEDGGPWLTISRYVQGSAAEETSKDPLFDDSFEIDFDLPIEPIAQPTRKSLPPRRTVDPEDRPLNSNLLEDLPPLPAPRDREEPATRDRPAPLDEDPPAADSDDDLETYRLAKPSDPSPTSTNRRRRLPPRVDEPQYESLDEPVDSSDSDSMTSALRALARDQAESPADKSPRQRGQDRNSSNDRADQSVASSPTGLHPKSRPLFNGRSLAGWTLFRTGSETDNDDEPWFVRGNILTFDGSATQTHLISTAEFQDFEAWIAWRTLEPESRGGFFLRSDINKNGLRSWISFDAANAGRMLGSGTTGSTAVPGLQKEPGQWNVWRIVAAGTRIGLWCNGHCAWNAARLGRLTGRIGLRGDGDPFEYRFIYLRDLQRK
jgi:hypothetical protein